jgi:hypothetical protein
MPPVGTLESSNDLPAVRFHIPRGSFQRLHPWLLVHRYHKETFEKRPLTSFRRVTPMKIGAESITA